LAVVLIFTAGAGAGLVVDQTLLQPTPASAVASNDAPSAFKEAWALVHDRYVDTKAIDDQKLLAAAISGMLDTLGDDGHTRYLDPSQVAQHTESLSGTFVGVGIQVEERDNRIVVVTPLDNSPAQRAGVKPGDVLIQVNGESVDGQPVDTAVSKIRGPEGSTVDLTFERPGESAPLTFTLERTKLEVTTATWTMLPNQIADIRLSQFSSGASDQLARAINAAQAAGATSIMLDLRNNPGGYVDEAIDVASLFLPDGAPVFRTQVRDGSQTIHRAQASPTNTTLPMVVLVNKGTASAAEIVAGALKEDGRAKVLGETTFGTGTLLNQFALSDGSAILLGTELWLTPNGNLIRGQGIIPSTPVSLTSVNNKFVPSRNTLDPAAWQQDSQVSRAASLLRGDPTMPDIGPGCSGCK
jgi:carboxyl-terminal processing protease